MGVAAEPARPRLSGRLVVALDVARAFAACYVVAHHLAGSRGWAQGPGLVLRFGQEAVIIFFLLSGVVIFANEHRRALAPRGYFVRRLRRIYPALIVALLVSVLVAWDNHDLLQRFRWPELAGNLLSLQDVSSLKPGVIIDPFLGNNPLWSLSYEMAFYLVFPFVLRAWLRAPRATNHVIGAICCLAYASFAIAPNHWSLVASYFLIWWAGAMAAEAYFRGGRSVLAMKAMFAWLVVLCVIAAMVVPFAGYRGLGLYPVLPLRHFLVAAIMLAVLFGPIGRAIVRGCASLAAPAAFLASISYGLYVLHYPLLVLWRRAQSPIGLGVAAMVLILLALAADRGLNRWLPRAPKARVTGRASWLPARDPARPGPDNGRSPGAGGA